MKIRISIIMLAILSMLGVTAMPQAAYASNDLASFANLSVEASPHTGSATFALPIDVVSGRAGIEPNIQLAYNSSSPNGLFGVGWSLEMGSIQRSTKDGVPSYTDDDTFVLIQSGKTGELVFDPGVGYYRFKTEGDFIRVEKQGQLWIATDKSGVRYTFGKSESAREKDPAAPERIFKWGLERVEDVHGNYMTIEYASDENKMWLHKIHYTGNAQQNKLPFATVTFKRDIRPDTYRFFRAGFDQKSVWRIAQIEVAVEGVVQREYFFEYDKSASTDRSLLRRVRLVGRDGVSELPAMEFDYQQNQLDFELIESTVDDRSGDNLWNIRQGGDFDRGHDNFITCGFDVDMGTIMTEASGRGVCGSFSTNTNTAQINVQSSQDCANEVWTYLFASEAKDITMNVDSNPQGLCVAVNGERVQDTTNLSLNKGWNVLHYIFHGQHAAAELNIASDVAGQVDLVNSKAIVLSTLNGDFNGDGFADIARIDDNTIKISLSREGVFLNEEVWYQQDNLTADHFSWFPGDFNNDGKTDFIRFDKDSGTWSVALSNGEGFNVPQSWIAGFAKNKDNTAIGDFNGDGRADIAYVDTDERVRFAMNEGGRFVRREGYNPIGVTDIDDQFSAVDWNGDGLADFTAFNKDHARVDIRVNPGSLDREFIGVGQGLEGVRGFARETQLIVADFNQDSLMDMGYYDHIIGKIMYRTLTNNGFSEVKQLPVTLSSRNRNTQIASADFNGDAVPDFVSIDAVGNAEIILSDGVRSDVLGQVDNGVGGFTSIKYVPVNKTLQNEMPFPMQVVQSITRSTSLGVSYRTITEYRDGLWSAKDREFRGFGTVRQMDADGNVVETIYHQDDVFKGRIKQQDTYDNNENLYARQVNTWAQQIIATGSDFVYLHRQDNFIFDGDQTGRRTAEEYFYAELPQRGNLTRTAFLGEVDLNTGRDIGQDSRSVVTQYLNNTSNYIIGLPEEITTRDHHGNEVRKVWFDYDDQSRGALPTKGLLTRKEHWSPDSEHGHVNTWFTYDALGNLRTTRDARNHTTTIEYDAQYGIFPLVSINALNHRVVNEYYGVNGVTLQDSTGLSGLWGQLKRTTDPNNNEGVKGYDVFGRSIFSVGPNDSVGAPSNIVEYDLTDRLSCIKSFQRIESGQEGMVETQTCFDGLGREVFSLSPGETPGQYVITGLTEYDSRGLPVKEYLPRFTTNPFEPVNPTWAHAMTEYDAVGRAVKTINPDKTYSDIQYDDWTTTSTSPSGHKQETDTDAFGRLIEKREYLGADGRDGTHYPAEAYQLYARTQYQYDSEGNLLKTIDAHNNVIEMRYDKLGRKVWMNDPDMGVWTYKYDASGNMIQQVDAKQQTLTFTYDELSRLTNKTDGGELNVDYTYDDPYIVESKGRITQSTYNGDEEHARFGYDELGREIRSVKLFNNTHYQVDREYDALNRIMNVTYPNQNEVHYAYNQSGQIEAIANMKEALPVKEIVVVDPPPELEPLDPNVKLLLSPRDGDSVVFDRSGRHTNLQTLGQVSVQDGATPFGPGKVLSFPDNNSAIQLPHHDDWLILEELEERWVIDLWVKHDNNAPGNQTYLSHYNSDSNYWELSHEQGKGLHFRVADNFVMRDGGLITDSEWHHVAIIKDGSDYGLYLDGKQVSFYAGDNTVSIEGPLYVGKRHSNVNHFTGQMYGVRVREGLGFFEENLGGAAVVPDLKNVSAELGVANPPSSSSSGKFNSFRLTQFETPFHTVELEFGSNRAIRRLDLGLHSAVKCDMKVEVRSRGSWIEVAKREFFVDYTDNIDIHEESIDAIRFRFNGIFENVGGVGLIDIVRDFLNKVEWKHLRIMEEVPTVFVPSGQFVLPGADQYASLEDRVQDESYSFMQYAEVLLDSVLGVKEAKAFSLVELLMQRNIMQHLREKIEEERSKKPTLKVAQNTMAVEGREVVIEIKATDASGEQLRFNRPQQSDLPNGASFQITRDEDGLLEGRIIWSTREGSADQYEIPIEVANARATSNQNVIVNIQPRGPIPLAEVYVENVDYTASGQIDRITLGNGVTTDFEYDPLTLRLKRKFTTNQHGTVLQHFLYSYDATGNIVNISDLVHSATQTFRYDALARLVHADGRSYGVKTYRYDEIGNIIEKDDKIYRYGENGAGPHAVTSLDDGSVFRYDANGNMTFEGRPDGSATRYTYDAENQLIEVEKNGFVTSQYTYDGDGGRTSKTVSGRVTKYIGAMYEESTSGNTQHIFLGDMRIASITNDDISYHHSDHLGGANVITNGSGTARELIEYEPYGTFSRNEKFGGGEEVAWHYFTGQHYDPETELYFYQARYYNPELGRFMTADSIVPYPDDAQAFNRYTYVRNNPVNLVDPSGHIFQFLFALGSFLATHVVPGAIFGAIVGGVVSVAMGGDFVDGAISGAISGGIFGGIGGLKFEGIAQTIAHAAGGAASGAINAARVGGDPVKAALLGGFSAGSANALAGVNPFSGAESELIQLSGEFTTRSIIGGAIGGVTSELGGGAFADGFEAGFYTAAVAFVSNHFLHEKVLPALKKVGNALKWWAYESAVPGPYGEPISEWEGGKPTGWGDPIKYTEGASASWKWSQRAVVGTAVVAVGAAVGGPPTAWIRLGGSYSQSLGARTTLSIRIGSNVHHASQKIGSTILRKTSVWLKNNVRFPGNSWRSADPGHFHLIR